ncbi:MAG: GIY-YIG nuclease family protein [Chloroflexota bacterium]
MYAYILSSHSRALYVGVTNDLQRRLTEHRDGTASAFTSRYRVTQLVYYEQYDDRLTAIGVEKQIKGWRRAKKIALIESVNPDWRNLTSDAVAG